MNEEIWASDEEVTKFLMWPAHKEIPTSETVLADWTKNYQNKDYYQWAIIFKEYGSEPIGCIGVNNSIDDQIQMAHIGYCIGKKWWHRGITSEALKCVIHYLFSQVRLRRIESRFDPRNLNSGAVMKKCGMKYEGTLRQADSYMIQTQNVIRFQGKSQCSAFSSAYVLRHFGVEEEGSILYQNILFKLPDGNVTPWGIHILFYQPKFSCSYRKGSIDSLKYDLQKGAPIIVFVHSDAKARGRHYVPVTGYDDKGFYLAESIEDLPINQMAMEYIIGKLPTKNFEKCGISRPY